MISYTAVFIVMWNKGIYTYVATLMKLLLQVDKGVSLG